MQRLQEKFLGRSELPPELTDYEVVDFFTLSDADKKSLNLHFPPDARSPSDRRILAALQLGFLKFTGNKLDSYSVIPRKLLEHLKLQLELDQVPAIASLARLNARAETRRRALIWAMDRAAFKAPTPKTDRQLADHLAEVARTATSVDELLLASRSWMFRNRLLMRAERALLDKCRRAFKDSEESLYKEICAAIPAATRTQWFKQVMELHEDKTRTVLEWLQEPPRKRTRKTMDDHFAKIDYLREMGVDKVSLGSITVERQRQYARQLQHRKPSRLMRLDEQSRTLELVCFLVYALMQASDIGIQFHAKGTSSMVGQARQDAIKLEAVHLTAFQHAAADIHVLIQNHNLDAAALREQIGDVLGSLDAKLYYKRPEATREQLTEKYKTVRRNMRNLLQLDIRASGDSLGWQALSTLKKMYQQKNFVPHADVKLPCRPSWNALVNESPDPAVRMRAFEASVAIEVQRDFNRGALYCPHSEAYREQDEILISRKLWSKQRRRHYQELGLPEDVKDFLQPQLDRLQAGLLALGKAVEAGDFAIVDGGLVALSKEQDEKPDGLAMYEALLTKEIGDVQFPDLIVEMDGDIQVTWHLNDGRPPANAPELRELYGGLIGHGTDRTAKAVAMSIRGLTPEQVSAAMRRMEAGNVLRAANEAVNQYTLRFPVSRLFGTGAWASADMMSLQARRDMHNARREPRLKVPAIGLYSHVSDRNVISYDQIIVLQTRQAGHAWEGALRQTDTDLSHLAVDSHGYTLWVLGASKHSRLDLCPRVADMGPIKLCVPRGIKVPEVLKPITLPLSLKVYQENYDELVRVAASVADGTTNAIVAARHFGSAARGQTIHTAGVTFGKLLRTNFICELYTNPTFRREWFRVLDQGEAMHQLNHAIHPGRISRDRGRRIEELTAVSGAVTLLSNLVVAWSTKHMQQALGRLAARGQAIPEEMVKHFSPVRFGNINLGGMLEFDVERHMARITGGLLRSRKAS